jgi:hypothetical protein
MIIERLDPFCAWLEQTPLALWLQSTEWAIPTVQTVHILAISLLMASMLMLNLRLLNAAFAEQPLPRVAARFVPVMWWMLPVLLLSGMLMITAEPARSLQNTAFQSKMLLLLMAIGLTLFTQSRVDTNSWGAGAQHWRKGLALASLAVWIGILFAGRWIAYVRVA